MVLRIICLNLVQILNLEAIIQIQNQVEIIIIQDLAMITNLQILDILPAITPDQVIVHHRLVHRFQEEARLVPPEVVRLEVVKLVNKN